jgi:GTP cyclohydrolase I
MTKNHFLGKAPIDKERIEHLTRELLIALGEDPDREGLKETPARVAWIHEITMVGYNDPPKIKIFKEAGGHDDIQARKCDFLSICEHHLVPMAGSIYVAYLPSEAVMGMDKIDLIVDYISGRLQGQERIAEEVADFIMNLPNLNPQGVMVMAVGIHYCALFKGNDGGFLTSATRGIMRDDNLMELKCIEYFKKLDEVDSWR